MVDWPLKIYISFKECHSLRGTVVSSFRSFLIYGDINYQDFPDSKWALSTEREREVPYYTLIARTYAPKKTRWIMVIPLLVGVRMKNCIKSLNIT
jgi:hypothetical protein